MTIQESFSLLPEDIQEKAFKNTGSVLLETEVRTDSTALKMAFIWLDTPEGEEYWERVHRKYELNRPEVELIQPKNA